MSAPPIHSQGMTKRICLSVCANACSNGEFHETGASGTLRAGFLLGKLPSRRACFVWMCRLRAPNPSTKVLPHRCERNLGELTRYLRVSVSGELERQ